MEWLTPEQRIARWRQRIWLTIQLARHADEFATIAADQPGTDSSQLAALGWRMLHAGDVSGAQAYFRAALHHDPYAISAWFGLSRTVAQPDLRQQYLQAALDLHHLVTNLEQTR